MNKKQLSEKELCQQVIVPRIEAAGWDPAQIKEEVVLTKGRVIVRGKLVTRGEQKRADYVLYYKPGIPLAVVEAKDNHHGLGAGMQQGLAYAEMLDVPFVFSTNGPDAPAVKPAMVPEMIARALAGGWAPEGSGPPFLRDYPRVRDEA